MLIIIFIIDQIPLFIYLFGQAKAFRLMNAMRAFTYKFTIDKTPKKTSKWNRIGQGHNQEYLIPKDGSSTN
jgi:hypothetical protein